MVGNATVGLRLVVEGVASATPPAASALVVDRVAKRVGPIAARNLRGADAALRARTKRENIVAQSSKAKKRSRDEASSTPALRPGVMLVSVCDVAARREGCNCVSSSRPIQRILCESRGGASVAQEKPRRPSSAVEHRLLCVCVGRGDFHGCFVRNPIIVREG